MEIEVKNKNKDELSFKAGDILALKIDSQGKETEETYYYYLLGTYDEEEEAAEGEDYAYFYLTDIKVGTMAKVLVYPSYVRRKIYLSRQEITNLIENYDGKVYTGNKAKVILKERKEMNR